MIFMECMKLVLPLRSVGRSYFDKGLHNLTTLIKKRHILMRTAVVYIYIYIVKVTLSSTLVSVTLTVIALIIRY